MRNAANPAILVVDDYWEMMRLLRRMLAQLGFADVDEAADGPAALSKLRERHYDLVICDRNMQPMSGLQVLREVRADRVLNTLPFIMITGTGEMDHVIAAKLSGVTDYIIKPFTLNTLQRKLAAALKDA